MNPVPDCQTEPNQAEAPQRLGYSFAEAAKLVGLPLNTFREAHSRGEFRARKVGKRWMVSRRELLRWLECTP